MAERLTQELLDELLNTSNIDSFLREQAARDAKDVKDAAAKSLPDYLQKLLDEKHLKRTQVVRMANLNETFGYQIFMGQRNPSRNKVLQIALAMALSLTETNRALTYAGVSGLYCKNRRDAIIIWCIDHGFSLVKTNEELYRLGEETIY